MRRALLTYLLLLAGLQTANAKEYLGFNLCERVTLPTLVSTVKAAGAEFRSLESLHEGRNVEFNKSMPPDSVSIRQYPINDARYTIELEFFRETLISITISDARHLQSVLLNQYGWPKKVSVDYGDGEARTEYFYPPYKDPKITISTSSTKIPVNFDPKTRKYETDEIINIHYECIGMQEARVAAYKLKRAQERGAVESRRSGKGL